MAFIRIVLPFVALGLLIGCGSSKETDLTRDSSEHGSTTESTTADSSIPENAKPPVQLSSQDRLKQVALAMHNCHDKNMSFPAVDGMPDRPNERGLSWRVHLLPFLGENELYKKFKLDEPWDSEQNRTLISLIPPAFDDNMEGKTRIQILTGGEAPFKTETGLKMREISDGMSNTIMLILAGNDKAETWTKPVGLEFNPDDPLQSFGSYDEGEPINVALFAGNIIQLSQNSDPDNIRKMVQHQDGEVPVISAAIVRKPPDIKSNLSSIGTAMYSSMDNRRAMPTVDGYTSGGNGLSWRVHLLPFMGKRELYDLYKKFRIDEPWDSEHNKALIPLMPEVYGQSSNSKSRIHMISGEGSAFEPGKPVTSNIFSSEDFKGTSYALMLVSAADEKADIWTKPSSLEFDPANPLNCLGTYNPEESINVVMFDTAVLSFPQNIDPETFKRMVQIRGEDLPDLSKYSE
ncbi:DUF1559 domain-containing protein [uncultured Rubinisphaera sp.]|uniref:DUF1559 family PulG-like putative transporter n=1 Tax=uncultured Rubinisphaera sp. TaxID=1678686 RepID=UPI0030DBF588|tara:strand:+ start:25849 stop:27231 length:1383 start_codon:yes stop_codon:yes gene_type:complete